MDTYYVTYFYWLLHDGIFFSDPLIQYSHLGGSGHHEAEIDVINSNYIVASSYCNGTDW